MTAAHIPPAWTERARCTEIGGDMFFPEHGESPARAKRVCARCDVRPQCLEYALSNNERFGVWGGTSEYERRQMRRQLRSAA
jgi:WhiB family redox-sensing transcriptional regulator